MDEVCRMKILIIDDKCDDQKQLQQILASEYDVTTAEEGQWGLTLVRKDIPNLIIVSADLPDTSGFNVLEQLKTDEQTSHIPVIIIADQLEAEEEERGLLLGAADYIIRPFSSLIFQARVLAHIENIKLRQEVKKLSLTDMETKLWNSHGFELRFEIEWAHVRRESLPIALIFLDIDQFDDFSQIYGDSQSTLLLQEVARVLKAVVRRTADVTARLGTSLFAILLPDTDTSAALTIATRIQTQIASLAIPTTECKWASITPSIGIATMNLQPSSHEHELIEAAEAALLKAQREGSDKIHLAS